MSHASHTWTEEDDIALLLAIEEVGLARDPDECQGSKAEPWWDTVAGNLYAIREGSARVTGFECRVRFTLLEEEGGVPPDGVLDVVSPDIWDKVVLLVARHESTVREHVVAVLWDLMRVVRNDLGEEGLLALLEAALDQVQAGAR